VQSLQAAINNALFLVAQRPPFRSSRLECTFGLNPRSWSIPPRLCDDPPAMREESA
jgi:hypothetical protein